MYGRKDCHQVRVVGMLHHAHSCGKQHVLIQHWHTHFNYTSVGVDFAKVMGVSGC